jgi:predicted RNA-binding protein with PIN domain
MKALIIDGYNAIYKIPPLQRLMDKSLHEARIAVTQLAKDYKRRCGGIDRICVVFDGKDEHRSASPLRDPEHVFSKTGEGDSEVIRTIKRLSPRHHVVVVSDDNFVRNNARAHSATVLSVAAFAASLYKEKSQRKKSKPSKHIDPDEASRITEELRQHWKL